MVSALRSVLIDVAGRGGLATEIASQIAVNATVGLFGPIYSKIEPARLGEATRAISVAQDYAVRLPGILKPGALEKLVSGYSSHSFVIEFEEIKTLFNDVRKPNQHELEIANHFGFFSTRKAIQESSLMVEYIPSGKLGGATHGNADTKQTSNSEDSKGKVRSSEVLGPEDVEESSNSAED